MFEYTIDPATFAVIITKDGVPVVSQPFKPEVEGFQPFTQAEAETFVSEKIAELQAAE